MTGIPKLPADASAAELADALDEAGCLVVTDVTSVEFRNRIESELSADMAAARVIEKDDPTQFYPGHTRRISALVGRSGAARELILNSISRDLCEHHLASNCERYQLHVTAALSVGPGARKQILHREEDPFHFFPLPRPNMILASMWAISDFTTDNGGTLLVPGSHRWGADRRAEPDEIFSAEMPAGSVLYWLGGTLHGAGANVSDSWRYGIILTYSLGWLRQEENQYMDIADTAIAELDPELRDLCGFAMHGGLGFYDPGARTPQPTAAPT